MLTLYQAEWCPFSSAVRERLTELGVDFVARQVAPLPEQREELQALAETGEIPTVHTDEGLVIVGPHAIFAFLATLEQGAHELAHRELYLEHREARLADATSRILEKATPHDGLAA